MRRTELHLSAIRPRLVDSIAAKRWFSRHSPASSEQRRSYSQLSMHALVASPRNKRSPSAAPPRSENRSRHIDEPVCRVHLKISRSRAADVRRQRRRLKSRADSATGGIGECSSSIFKTMPRDRLGATNVGSLSSASRVKPQASRTPRNERLVCDGYLDAFPGSYWASAIKWPAKVAASTEDTYTVSSGIERGARSRVSYQLFMKFHESAAAAPWPQCRASSRCSVRRFRPIRSRARSRPRVDTGPCSWAKYGVRERDGIF